MVAGVTVLVDPWLIGDLTFLEQYWIYRGQKIKAQDLDVQAIANSSDIILITQVPDAIHTLGAVSDSYAAPVHPHI
jgi:hypothetical protein